MGGRFQMEVSWVFCQYLCYHYVHDIAFSSVLFLRWNLPTTIQNMSGKVRLGDQ